MNCNHRSDQTCLTGDECAECLRENVRQLRRACQRAHTLSAMRSEPYIPQDIRNEIESTLDDALKATAPNEKAHVPLADSGRDAEAKSR